MSNVNISGGGKIEGGTYEKINVSGSGKMYGTVICENLNVSGGTTAEGDVEVTNKAVISGSFKGQSMKAGVVSTSGGFTLQGDLNAENLSVSGSAKILGNAEVRNTCKVSGGLTVNGDLYADEVRISGGAKVGGKIHGDLVHVDGGITTGGDIEGEKLKLCGGVKCSGTINGEDILIDGGGFAGYVGGSNIYIGDRERNTATGIKKFLLSLSINKIGKFIVNESVEGDIIFMEDTKAVSVSGQTVTIGKGCEIDKVRYSLSCNIDKSAKVNIVEKVDHDDVHLMIEND